MHSYAAEVFSAVLPRMRFLKLKARSHAPGFAYIHAPPAPYKGTQHDGRVQSKSTESTRKQLVNESCQSGFVYITFSHLADTFVQSDVQGIEQSRYEQ